MPGTLWHEFVFGNSYGIRTNNLSHYMFKIFYHDPFRNIGFVQDFKRASWWDFDDNRRNMEICGGNLFYFSTTECSLFFKVFMNSTVFIFTNPFLFLRLVDRNVLPLPFASFVIGQIFGLYTPPV